MNSDCSHCHQAGSVFPVHDAAHSRTIFVCMACRWWGTKPDAIAYPLPEKAKVRIEWPERGSKET
jgi:hypothetical protein